MPQTSPSAQPKSRFEPIKASISFDKNGKPVLRFRSQYPVNALKGLTCMQTAYMHKIYWNKSVGYAQKGNWTELRAAAVEAAENPAPPRMARPHGWQLGTPHEGLLPLMPRPITLASSCIMTLYTSPSCPALHPYAGHTQFLPGNM